ncbi:unnamed protein product, partial [Nesidiocoris tenuis]
MWWTITGNFGNILPIDWSKSYARKLHMPALNLNENKSKVMDEGELSSEDEAVASDLDMHSLILSGFTQDAEPPVKTADEVIREIDDIMEYLTTVIPYHMDSGPLNNQALQVLIKNLPNIEGRIQILRKNGESKSPPPQPRPAPGPLDTSDSPRTTRHRGQNQYHPPAPGPPATPASPRPIRGWRPPSRESWLRIIESRGYVPQTWSAKRSSDTSCSAARDEIPFFVVLPKIPKHAKIRSHRCDFPLRDTSSDNSSGVDHRPFLEKQGEKNWGSTPSVMNRFKMSHRVPHQ